jgi:hypothetical protein
MEGWKNGIMKVQKIISNFQLAHHSIIPSFPYPKWFYLALGHYTEKCGGWQDMALN